VNAAFLSLELVESDEYFALGLRSKILLLQSLVYVDDYARLPGSEAVYWSRKIANGLGLTCEDLGICLAELRGRGFYVPYSVQEVEFFTVPYMLFTQRFEHRYVLKARWPNPFSGVPEDPIRWCDYLSRLGTEATDLEALGQRNSVSLALQAGDGQALSQGRLDLLAVERGTGCGPGKADLRERVMAMKRTGMKTEDCLKYFASFGHDVREILAIPGPVGRGAAGRRRVAR
jgi:hypothetical protein